MNAKAKHYLALAPAVLVSLFLMIVSGAPKLLVHNQAMTDMAVSVFGSVNILYGIGVLEILIAILLLIPRTRTLGFLMSVGLLGGATATGLTTDIEGMFWWFPLVVLALLMITAYFTLPELLDRAKGKPVPNTKSMTLRIFGWVLVLLLLAMHTMALQSKIMPPAEGTPGYAMSVALGTAFGRIMLPLAVTWVPEFTGVVQWFAVAVFISILSFAFPAWAPTRPRSNRARDGPYPRVATNGKRRETDTRNRNEPNCGTRSDHRGPRCRGRLLENSSVVADHDGQPHTGPEHRGHRSRLGGVVERSGRAVGVDLPDVGG